MIKSQILQSTELNKNDSNTTDDNSISCEITNVTNNHLMVKIISHTKQISNIM